MIDLLILFLFLTGAISATLFFLQGAFHLARSVSSPTLWEKVRRSLLPPRPHLARSARNPILSPTPRSWEASAVMNPAAIVWDGAVHLFYRAIGTDGVSRVGYARSEDGLHFDERLPYPAFALADGDGLRKAEMRKRYHPELYRRLLSSGGSWGGVEDPRAVVIDDRLFLSFSAFNSWDSLRIGVASLSLDDFAKKRWLWSKPVFLSAPREVHKNWVLFPRKINGKYAILHGFKSGTRRRANIEYLDTLDEEPKAYVESDARFRDDPREFDDNVWDSRIRGSGPPPLETARGWLVFYHANDAREPHKYKLGVLLLDRADPTKVIARSPYPVLEPDMPYENGQKPVVYATGAVVKDGTLILYYGGGDNVICAAAAPLSEFLDTLTGRMKPAFPIRAESRVALPA